MLSALVAIEMVILQLLDGVGCLGGFVQSVLNSSCKYLLEQLPCKQVPGHS